MKSVVVSIGLLVASAIVTQTVSQTPNDTDSNTGSHCGKPGESVRQLYILYNPLSIRIVYTIYRKHTFI